MSSMGVVAGLATAVLWALTAISFEAAAKRVGSLAVNVLRLAVAALLFVGLSLLRSGQALPPGLTPSAWFGLSLSGLVGFVIGDLMLFQAFVLIGARMSMLVYASVPAMTALAGYAFLGETIRAGAMAGMGLTVAGILLAVVGKGQPAVTVKRPLQRTGILLAVGGSAGQAAGLLLAKHGAVGLDSFSATQVRVLAGLLGFLAVAVLAGQMPVLGSLLKRALSTPTDAEAVAQARSVRLALAFLCAGALLGPFLGVSLGLLSAQLLPVGVASTLMSLVPVLLIPIAAITVGERASRLEMVGTAVAFAGVVVMTL